MSPALSDFTTRLKPSDYVESLSPFELYELGHEMTKKDYFCELLEGVEEPSEEELKEITTQYEENFLPPFGGSIDVVHVTWSKCPAGDYN